MKERRSSRRPDINLAAFFQEVDSGDYFFDVTLVNISESGMCFFSDEVLETGTRIKLSLALNPSNQVEMYTDVVWCTRDEDAHKYRVGVKIVDPIADNIDEFLDLYLDIVARHAAQ